MNLCKEAEALEYDALAERLRMPDQLRVIGTAQLAELRQAVRDVIADLDGPPLQRRVDAIEVLERLLLEAGVSPWAYCHALPFATGAARQAIAELRRMVAARDERGAAAAQSNATVS